MGKKYAFYGTALFFMLLSLLATVKICFLYLDIDEEYAVTLSWRILSEDRMLDRKSTRLNSSHMA